MLERTRSSAYAALTLIPALLWGCGADEGELSIQGRSEPLVLLDTDGDGIEDAIDFDEDGTGDLSLGDGDLPCVEALLYLDADLRADGIDLDCDGVAELRVCDEPLIDLNGDSIPDGMDVDCDGATDVNFESSCLPLLSGEGSLDLDCDGVVDVDLSASIGSAVADALADLSGLSSWLDLDGDSLADLEVFARDVVAFVDGCVPAVHDLTGDGIPDGLDVDCDGIADVDLLVPADVWSGCVPGLLDDDSDSVPEGLDLDCDGTADESFAGIEGLAECSLELAELGGELGDGIDLDCDGTIDIALPSIDVCVPVSYDDDGDGVPEAMDLDCDGAIDLEIPSGY